MSTIFRTYLLPNWKTDPSWEILAQWHGKPDKNLGEPHLPPGAKQVLVVAGLEVRALAIVTALVMAILVTVRCPPRLRQCLDRLPR